MSLLEPGRRPSILIKIVGEGSRRLAHASPGEPFDLLLPLGNRWSPCPPGHTPLLVAGGVGIAPLLFFARELAAAGQSSITLYGGRSANDLPLHDELARVSEVHLLTEDGSRGTRGRVTALLEPMIRDAKGPIKIYTCGPDRMMAAVAAIAQKAGVLCEASDETQIYACGPDRMMAAVAEQCAERHLRCEVSLETPMACGYGVCLGCPVRRSSGGFLYACMDGPCVDARDVAWES